MEKKKVMIIDDEEGFLKVAKLNLEEVGGYEVLTLSSAKDMMTHVYDFKPDIILLDILMPGMDGISACKLLNDDAVGIGKGIPIIIISALSKDVDKLKAYKSGVVDYLVKPVREEQLLARIKKALQYKST